MPPNVLPVTHRFNSSAARPADYLDLPNRPNSLISFSAIERTGHVPTHGLLSTLTGQDLRVDLNAQDAYVQALNQMITRTQEKLQSSPIIAGLFAKPTWDKSDRTTWETALSEAAITEMHAIHSLDTYRTEPDDTATETLPSSVKRDPLVNRISRDILSSDPPVYEFDCEQMSLTLGLAMQKVERNMLPVSSDPSTLRAVHNYYYTAGVLHEFPEVPDKTNPPPSGHALITSSATGNFIEATSRNISFISPVYRVVPQPGHDFSEFLRTGTAVISSQSIFTDTKDTRLAQEAMDNSDLISWCVRRLSDRPTLPPDCNKPVVTTALQKLPKY